MAIIPFGKKSIKKLNNIIDTIFNALKVKFLGFDYAKDKGNRSILISANIKPELTLAGIYKQAAVDEGAKPDEEVLAGLMSIAEGYLDAEKSRTQAKILNKINEAVAGENPMAVVTRELGNIWTEAASNITRIVENETNTAKNIGALEGIVKINASAGIKDPQVAFIGPNDENTCEECIRVLLLPDKITPRVFLLSEVNHGYHKRGTDSPSMSMHPRCRHSIISLLPGYGFRNGSIAFISFDHDEYKAQRGQ